MRDAGRVYNVDLHPDTWWTGDEIVLGLRESARSLPRLGSAGVAQYQFLMPWAYADLKCYLFDQIRDLKEAPIAPKPDQSQMQKTAFPRPLSRLRTPQE